MTRSRPTHHLEEETQNTISHKTSERQLMNKLEYGERQIVANQTALIGAFWSSIILHTSELYHTKMVLSPPLGYFADREIHVPSNKICLHSVPGC